MKKNLSHHGQEQRKCHVQLSVYSKGCVGFRTKHTVWAGSHMDPELALSALAVQKHLQALFFAWQGEETVVPVGFQLRLCECQLFTECTRDHILVVLR